MPTPAEVFFHSATVQAGKSHCTGTLALIPYSIVLSTYIVINVCRPTWGNLDSGVTIVGDIRDQRPMLIVLEVAVSLTIRRGRNEENGLTWFNSTGRVLSPTTRTTPASFQALSASPLCKPVIAGGMMPLLNLVALVIPTAASQPWFHVSSL